MVMMCRDIMKRDVKCVSEQATVAQAAALMRDEQIGFVPVCDPAGNVIGTLTDRDIAIRVVAENQPADEPVKRFITPNVVACESKEDLSAALDLMGEMQVSRIVCVSEDGHLEGVISLSDIAQLGDGADPTETLRSVSAREARSEPGGVSGQA
jgi:CBS domain-containing protein